MQFFTESQQLFTLIFAIHFTLIIDRVNRAYNPYDTYNAWKGQLNAIMRLLLSWSVMYILPLINFAIFLLILGAYDVSFDPNLNGVLNIVLVCLSSFFDFGYYRIFESILYLSPKSFYTDKEAVDMLDDNRNEFQAHFIPGILYIIASSIMIIIVIFLK